MEQAQLVDDLREWLMRQREWAVRHDPAMASRLAFWIVACRDASTRLRTAEPGTRRAAAMDVDVLLEKAFAFAQANAAIGAPGRRWWPPHPAEREGPMLEGSRSSHPGPEANPN